MTIPMRPPKQVFVFLAVPVAMVALVAALWRPWRVSEPPARLHRLATVAPVPREVAEVPAVELNDASRAAMLSEHTGDSHGLAVGSLVALAKSHQQLTPGDIQALLSFIAAPKPADLTSGDWQERVNVILNLLRQQSHVPGLTKYLLATADKGPSRVLRLYAMQHLSLWYPKAPTAEEKQGIIKLLEDLASKPGGDTAGCALLMLADMRRQDTRRKTQDAREEVAGSLASSGASVVTNAPTEDGVDWAGVDELVGRESGRIIGDREAPQDVRISAIHACVDRKDAAPLPELRNIAADKSLVSTLRKAAIHAIGQLGDDEDLTLLESLSGDNGNLLPAVGPARTALIKRKSGTK